MSTLSPDPPNAPPSIPPPDDWDEWSSRYISKRHWGYKPLLDRLPESFGDYFEYLKFCVQVNARHHLVRGIEFEGQPTEKVASFVDAVMKQHHEFALFEGGWPIKALGAKFLQYSRPGETRRSRTYVSKRPRSPKSTSERSQPGFKRTKRYAEHQQVTVRYLGQKPSEAALTQLQTELNTRHLRRPYIAQQAKVYPRSRFATISLNSSDGEATDSESGSAQISPLPNDKQRKPACLRCHLLEPCPRDFVRQISDAFPPGLVADLEDQFGVIDDYHLNLLLRFSEEDRKTFWASRDYPKFKIIQMEKRLQGMTQRDVHGASSRDMSYGSLASSGSSGTLGGPDDSPCTRCGHEASFLQPVSPKIQTFLRSAGLLQLLPAFTEMQVVSDKDFDELCDWTEDDRTELFNGPGPIHFNPFQRFALKMAFRLHHQD